MVALGAEGKKFAEAVKKKNILSLREMFSYCGNEICKIGKSMLIINHRAGNLTGTISK